jgi:hypothetical protein
MHAKDAGAPYAKCIQPTHPVSNGVVVFLQIRPLTSCSFFLKKNRHPFFPKQQQHLTSLLVML